MAQRWSDGVSADPRDWLGLYYVPVDSISVLMFAFLSFHHLVHDQVELELELKEEENERWPRS